MIPFVILDLLDPEVVTESLIKALLCIQNKIFTM